MISLDDALNVIRTTASMGEASQMRNVVAMQAMQGRRPETDADACREAYAEKWGHVKPYFNMNVEPPKTYWTGD